jgi:hypothetical protein
MTNPNPDSNAIFYIEEVSDLIVQTREFCGNVNAAIKEWEDENGKLKPEERSAAIKLSLQKWNESSNKRWSKL